MSGYDLLLLWLLLVILKFNVSQELIVFSHFIDAFLTILVSALTSSILLSGFVVSMTMPELKRKPPAEQ